MKCLAPLHLRQAAVLPYVILMTLVTAFAISSVTISIATTTMATAASEPALRARFTTNMLVQFSLLRAQNA